MTNRFPYQIGYDVAGTIAAVGSAVSHLKVGDEVYARVPEAYRGTVAQYALSTESATALKPASLDFDQAAATPLAALTALQSLEYADKTLPGGLKGKTVFVPAGLSGVGSFALQLARNVFEARVITTLSTGKMELADRLFGQERIQYVDYTKGDVVDAIGKNKVDFFFDTVKGTVPYLPVVKKGGLIVSISTIPPGRMMKNDEAPDLSFFPYMVMTIVDWFYRTWTSWSRVQYTYHLMGPDREGLEHLAEYIKEVKVTPVVGKTAKLSDVEGVRKGCQEVYLGKGGLGKFVIEVD